MKRFAYFVNPQFLTSLLLSALSTHLHVLFREGPNYNKAFIG